MEMSWRGGSSAREGSSESAASSAMVARCKNHELKLRRGPGRFMVSSVIPVAFPTHPGIYAVRCGESGPETSRFLAERKNGRFNLPFSIPRIPRTSGTEQMIAHYKRGWNVKMAAMLILSAFFYLCFTAIIVFFGPPIIRQAITDRQWVLLVLPLGFLVGWGVWTYGMFVILGPEITVEIAKGHFSMRSGPSFFRTQRRFALAEIKNAYLRDTGLGLFHLILEMKDGSHTNVHTLLSPEDLREVIDRLRKKVGAKVKA